MQADIRAPSVLSTFPIDKATGAATSSAISANFDEELAAGTVTKATFTIQKGTEAVLGAVTYFNKTATFLPTSDLALDTKYTATLTTDITDVAGNALEEETTWSFTTDATLPLGPAPVQLGAAGNYVVLAKSAISNVPTSKITGNLGLSPAADTYITGFSPTRAGTKWTSAQVTGGLFGPNNDPPTPSNLTTAVSNMQAAYTDAAGRSTPDFTNLGGGAIGGMTLTPGLYKWSSSVTIPTDVTISGAANDVWIFQITGNLTLSGAKKMTLTGDAQAKNIFWQVAGAVDFGTTSHAEGVVLSKTKIKLGTGASINGRLLAQTAVNLASSTVTAP